MQFCTLSAFLVLNLTHQTTSLAADAKTTKPPVSSSDTCSSAMPNLRAVRKIMPRPSPHWVGDGFRVYPVFANLAFSEELSPLLMFDYAEPKEFEASARGAPRGVGMHPHRGFETVTVAFQGEVEHHDNKGNQGVIKAGDVQWMTAGRGIVHQEYHSKDFTREGGTFEMCQLWVDLPKEHKMTKPRYQEIPKAKIPVVDLPIGTPAGQKSDDKMASVRLIAGECSDVEGAASTFSPVQVWDVSLPTAGVDVDIPFPAEHSCIVFVRRGSVDVISSGTNDDELESGKLGPQDVALMHMDGSSIVRLRGIKPNSSVLILGGKPLNQPIAAQGPFVMNTQEELQQAMTDFRMGKF